MAFDETARALRDGKTGLRKTRRSASFNDKLIDLWRVQHAYVQIVGSRRPLKPWERPWNILSDVRDAIALKGNLVEDSRRQQPVSASRSRWVRSRHPWILSI